MLPLLVAGCYMTLGQALVISGLDFYPMRILIFLGMIRVFLKREWRDIKLNGIDFVLIAWLLMTSFLYLIFDGTNTTLTQRLGYAYDVVGIYGIVRWSVRTVEDIVLNVKILAVSIVPLGVLFVVENVTAENPFAALWGIPLTPEIRDGRVRSTGPFLHPILAGTLGATALPLFVGLWGYQNRNRILAGLGILGAIAIVFASGSSGPLVALAAGIVALMCWPLRSRVRVLRWAIWSAVLALALVMNAPVWFVIQRLSDLTGGGGWYRSALIDAAVRHFDEWWLVGTGYTAHWMPTGITADPNSADIVNEFVSQGIRGGILTLLLFVWLIVRCFKAVGASVRDTADFPADVRFVFWALGCGLLAHVASFFSVSYFDQIRIFLFSLVGMIAVLYPQTFMRQSRQPLNAKPTPAQGDGKSSDPARLASRPALAPAIRNRASESAEGRMR